MSNEPVCTVTVKPFQGSIIIISLRSRTPTRLLAVYFIATVSRLHGVKKIYRLNNNNNNNTMHYSPGSSPTWAKHIIRYCECRVPQSLIMNYEWCGVTYRELTLSLPACTSAIVARTLDKSESVNFHEKQFTIWTTFWYAKWLNYRFVREDTKTKSYLHETWGKFSLRETLLSLLELIFTSFDDRAWHISGNW